MSVTPGPTVGFTIGTAQFPTLTAQPFSYEESEVQSGRTARKWILEGLLKPSEWVALLSVYDTWRDIKIGEPEAIVSGTVGTTVALSGNGAGGQTWTSVACWFASPPSGEQVGNYISTSVELIDANQALEVALKAEQAAEEEEDLPDFGTYTIGTTTLTLTKLPDAYREGPSLTLAATGKHYIEGPLVVERIKDIEGTTTATGWAGVKSWYETQIVSTPASGTWFPISSPTATVENKIVSGVKIAQYTVSIQLGQVL